MTQIEALEAWWRRPVEVKVWDRCTECEQLKDDVKERQNYWPTLKATCCGPCFSRLIAAYEGLTYC